ncbi:hypothetical protein HK100_005797 [Physocladia obscura]|uniref:Uncharacterized protein n=1 Tax=Physocladia obscura TaxID=109957 RepID=A0AAD5XBP6_9FUNG|nr:hypothetical protein HK100_005797 [Physocladia obscura]
MSSRVPPGGYTSISLGGEPVAASKAPTPAAATRAAAAAAAAPIWAQPPVDTKPQSSAAAAKRVVPGQHSTLVLGSDASSPQSPPELRGRSQSVGATRNNHSNIFDSADTSSTATTEPTQSISKASKKQAASAIIPIEDPQPFTPSRRIIKPAGLESGSEEIFTPNLRQAPQSVSQRLGSTVPIAHDDYVPTKTTVKRSKSISNVSQVVLGDDSPKAPVFTPKKFSAGIKIARRPVERVGLAEFTGFSGAVEDGGKTVGRVDPASVKVAAGETSGKHMVR